VLYCTWSTWNISSAVPALVQIVRRRSTTDSLACCVPGTVPTAAGTIACTVSSTLSSCCKMRARSLSRPARSSSAGWWVVLADRAALVAVGTVATAGHAVLHLDVRRPRTEFAYRPGPHQVTVANRVLAW
jgi:hypothetical protein